MLVVLWFKSSLPVRRVTLMHACWPICGRVEIHTPRAESDRPGPTWTCPAVS